MDKFKYLFPPGFIGSRYKINTDLCSSHPCKNGATCIDQPGNYFCHCVAPFKDSYHDLGPCEATPCENGAVFGKKMDLEISPLGYQCQCAKGFAGPHCEINVNECSSSPCLHGYCYDSEFTQLQQFL
ncbi:unnamed protein product [Gulo gulo]|uniref:EGF-like domain-containing protein n=1 Tax=Gulo gulo TaxID=48420 RepID=A0A9X9LHI8_GULGU|nr:unnamed protein product [Gulo gulo]